MFDIPRVQVIADAMNFYHLVIWIEDNKADYVKGILHGFEEEENETLSQKQPE
jgi:small nuclear ribonucleoprotein (snRNP)-like protein